MIRLCLVSKLASLKADAVRLADCARNRDLVHADRAYVRCDRAWSVSGCEHERLAWPDPG